jgi:hypothetical protein
MRLFDGNGYDDDVLSEKSKSKKLTFNYGYFW